MEEIKAESEAAAKDQHFHSRLKVFKEQTRKELKKQMKRIKRSIELIHAQFKLLW